FVLIGVGLQMGAVRVQHGPVNEAMFYGLQHDLIEDVLRDRGVIVPTPTVLRERRCIKDAIGQLQSKKPPTSNIDLDLPNQLTFGSNAEKISEEQRLEHQGRIQRWATVIRAVKRRRQRMNEGKVDHRFDLPKQVILRDHLFNRNHVKDGLDSAGL